MPTHLHEQHLPEDLIGALARRSAPPRLRRDGRGWSLELAGEPPSPFDPHDHDASYVAQMSAAWHGFPARTLDSMLRMVGVDRLVHGSDRPVIAASGPRALGTVRVAA